MYINIWFVGPTNCFTKIARPLYSTKLRCYFHSTDKALMHIKLKWIGGTAEQKRPPVCSTSLPFSQCPWSIFVFVSPLTNSKRAQFFYSLLSQIHSFHKASGLSHDGRQTDKYKIRILFLITVHKITRLSLPFTLLSRLFIYVYSNKRRITKDMHLPNTSNYDYISTSRTMPTLVKVSFYSRASLCDELSMEMMLSD